MYGEKGMVIAFVAKFLTIALTVRIAKNLLEYSVAQGNTMSTNAFYKIVFE